jgi:hypothetical protein
VYEYDTPSLVLKDVDGSTVDGLGVGVSTVVEGSIKLVELAGGGAW